MSTSPSVRFEWRTGTFREIVSYLSLILSLSSRTYRSCFESLFGFINRKLMFLTFGLALLTQLSLNILIYIDFVFHFGMGSVQTLAEGSVLPSFACKLQVDSQNSHCNPFGVNKYLENAHILMAKPTF